MNSLGCDLRQESPESQNKVWMVGAGQEADGGTKPQGACAMAKGCPRASCTGERGSETALCLGEKSPGQGEVGATSAEALGYGALD